MTIVAPVESSEEPRARDYLQRVVESGGPVKSVHHLDLRQSMENGGGPACLRQRIVLDDAERRAVKARVFWDEGIGGEVGTWGSKRYRGRVVEAELADTCRAWVSW